jgi:hypothetical protein
VTVWGWIEEVGGRVSEANRELLELGRDRKLASVQHQRVMENG